MSEEFIGGKNPVIEALKSGRDINKVWVAEGSHKGQMKQVIHLAKEAGVLVNFVPRNKVDQLLEGQNQGVVASVAAYQYAEIDDMLELAKSRNEDPFILLLDELEEFQAEKHLPDHH